MSLLDFSIDRPSQPGEPTWEVLQLFPRQGQWTEAEYLTLENTRPMELVGGCLELLPMPTLLHQLIVQFLLDALRSAVVSRGEGGLVVIAPLPIRLFPGTLREPDVVFFERSRIRDPKQPPEGADLVIEVVSEGRDNHKRDWEDKRADYARAGIVEYWIVDPEDEVISVLVLENGAYREDQRCGTAERAVSRLMPEFQVAVAAVFAAGKVN
jgi:Uma2 family endonuclease